MRIRWKLCVHLRKIVLNLNQISKMTRNKSKKMKSNKRIKSKSRRKKCNITKSQITMIVMIAMTITMTITMITDTMVFGERTIRLLQMMDTI